MAADGVNRYSLRLVGVNLKTVANTIIVPALAGAFFIPEQLFARQRTISGSGTRASVSVDNGGSYPVSTAAVFGLPGGNAVDEIIEMALNGCARRLAYDIGTTGIAFKVTGGSTFTTDTCDVYVEGLIV